MDQKTIEHRLGDAALLAIGIDVSKAQLVVGAINEGRPQVLTLDNDQAHVEALGRALCARGFTGKIVLESTGYYHWCAAVGLAEAGLDVRLVNPLMASKHARSAIRKTKTDPVDTIGLGHLGLTERRLPPRFDKSPTYVRLRHQMGLVQKLDKLLQSLQAAVKDFQAACECVGESSDSPAFQTLLTTVQQLRTDKRRLLAEFEHDVTQHNDGPSTAYQSVPGISATAAAVMQLMLNPQVERANAWIAYSGLDLSVRRSGTWVGRSRLSKRGNPYLRKRLYQAGWGAAMNDADFKGYYDQLRSQGRAHKEAVVIIARKLLRIAFNLAKTGQTYDRTVAWA